MRLGFSWEGLIIFMLPMFINIAYVIWPPVWGDMKVIQKKFPLLEGIEQSTRIAYVVLLCLYVNEQELVWTSWLLYVSILFLVLYHLVWFRYFRSGRAPKLLGEKFWGIPIPLAIFPVLYYFFAALWLHNVWAAVVMVPFGIAHGIVSYRNTVGD